ncbi:MAG: site-specific integrase, partial [Candidatus Dormibacteraeota bacterium]|nr:site-specific integrase [Candidatus Dormibacteraeota bacterium]
FSITSRRNVLDNLLGGPLSAFRSGRDITSVKHWNGDLAAGYLRWLQDELRRDSATIKKVRSQLRSFGVFCHERLNAQSIAGTALAEFDVSTEADYERRTDRPLNHAEVDTLTAAARTARDHLAMAMLLYTGMRPGELIALDISSIRLDTAPPVVELRGAAHAGANAKAERDIPLTIGQTFLPKLLRTHLADPARSAGASRLLLSHRSDARGVRRPLTLNGLRAMLFDLGVQTGIRCNAYRLRHTFCTWCAGSGLPMTHLQQLLGHATSDGIEQYYRGRGARSALEDAARLRF